MRQYRFDEALNAFQRALGAHVFSDKPEIFALMARCHEKLGQYDEAVRLMRQAADRFPGDPVILNQLGWSLIHQGSRAQGMGLCRRAEELQFGGVLEPTQRATFRLPFEGQWRVSQGNDGEQTHFGLDHKFAYDFAPVDSSGSYFRGDGRELEDYYAFDQPILSPCDGVVYEAVDIHPDQPPSRSFNPRAPPNRIILRVEPEGWISISHLKQGSLQVRPGQAIRSGQVLARCGNSGYSTSPHIHIHFSLDDPSRAVGAPFAFSGYRVGSRRVARGVPQQGEIVEQDR
jgi:hypothetical protein